MVFLPLLAHVPQALDVFGSVMYPEFQKSCPQCLNRRDYLKFLEKPTVALPVSLTQAAHVPQAIDGIAYVRYPGFRKACPLYLSHRDPRTFCEDPTVVLLVLLKESRPKYLTDAPAHLMDAVVYGHWDYCRRMGPLFWEYPLAATQRSRLLSIFAQFVSAVSPPRSQYDVFPRLLPL